MGFSVFTNMNVINICYKWIQFKAVIVLLLLYYNSGTVLCMC